LDLLEVPALQVLLDLLEARAPQALQVLLDLLEARALLVLKVLVV
jgi:hypothetical protein